MMLLAMIGIGIVSACMAGASRGNAIAIGLATSMLATAVPFAMFAIVYWLAFAMASLTNRAPEPELVLPKASDESRIALGNPDENPDLYSTDAESSQGVPRE